MILGVDGTPIQGVRSGPGWYLTHLLEALSMILEEDKVYVWMNGPQEEDRQRVTQNRFMALAETHYPAAALKMSWSTLGTPTLESLAGRPLDGCFYASLPVPPQKRGAKILFVHDLASWTAPEWAMSPKSKNYGKELEKQIGDADLVLTASEFNHAEILRLFPSIHAERIRVVPLGIAKGFQKPASPVRVAEVRKRLGLDHPYFLYAGTIESRKNLLRLVHAFLLFQQQTKSDAEMILVGPKGWVGEEFMLFLQSPALRGKAKWLDAVDPETLAALYTGAELFAYPALSEGFGLPMLEAMGCGTPVLCANAGALPEVAGEAAMILDPNDVGQWSEAFRKVHNDPDLREGMRMRGTGRAGLYRWEKTAKQTLAALVSAARARG